MKKIQKMTSKGEAPPFVKMMAGMAAGVVEACSLQPLDVVKTRLQLDRVGKYTGIRQGLSNIAREEGFFALYKGLTPFTSHLVMKYAWRYGSYALFQQGLNSVLDDKIGIQALNFGSGMLSGVTEAILIVTPFEVVKTRMQKERHSLGSSFSDAKYNLRNSFSEPGFQSEKRPRYRNTWDAASGVIRTGGIRALWSGVVPTILRQGSNQALNFLCFSELNRRFWKKRDGDGQQLAFWKTSISGILAGSMGPCVNNPVDVVKTRLMAQERARKGWLATTQKIARQEGVGALWRGLMPRLMRVAPGQAITWSVVSRITSYFERDCEER